MLAAPFHAFPIMAKPTAMKARPVTRRAQSVFLVEHGGPRRGTGEPSGGRSFIARKEPMTSRSRAAAAAFAAVFTPALLCGTALAEVAHPPVAGTAWYWQRQHEQSV